MVAMNLILALLGIAAVAAVCLVGFRAGRPEPARTVVEELPAQEDERLAA